jgi:hypothetical protein
VFLVMSGALRQMAATQWPGLTDQGVWLITDLTQPVVALTSNPMLAGSYCPFGIAGFLMPAALVWLYRNIVQSIPLGERDGQELHSRGLKLQAANTPVPSICHFRI